MALTIITLTYNNTEEFLVTASSIRTAREHGAKFKWLIVDGRSDDNHKNEIIQAKLNTDELIFDDGAGIYAAMNKALEHLPTSEHAVFINSGDALLPDVSDVIDKLDTKTSYCFTGFIVTKLDVFHRKWVVRKDGCLIPMHGAFVFATSHSHNRWFDTKYPVNADVIFMHKIISREQVEYRSDPITVFKTGGVSTGENWRSFQKLVQSKGGLNAPKYLIRLIALKVFGHRAYRMFYHNRFKRLDKNKSNEIMRLIKTDAQHIH